MPIDRLFGITENVDAEKKVETLRVEASKSISLERIREHVRDLEYVKAHPIKSDLVGKERMRILMFSERPGKREKRGLESDVSGPPGV